MSYFLRETGEYGEMGMDLFAKVLYKSPAISGDLLSAVISIRYILGFRKDNPNVFNMLVQDLPIASGIKCICC